MRWQNTDYTVVGRFRSPSSNLVRGREQEDRGADLGAAEDRHSVKGTP